MPERETSARNVITSYSIHYTKLYELSQKHQYANLTSLFGQLFAELADWQHPTFLVLDRNNFV